jgi:hypothetical protein
MKKVQVYAIRHQHAGVLTGKLYQTPPSEDVVASVTLRMGAGWTKIVPVELEIEEGKPFDEAPAPERETQTIDASEVASAASVGIMNDLVISGTATVSDPPKTLPKGRGRWRTTPAPSSTPLRRTSQRWRVTPSSRSRPVR